MREWTEARIQECEAKGRVAIATHYHGFWQTEHVVRCEDVKKTES